MHYLPDLFFPQPDALRVFSHDNSSYWLILFARSDLLVSWRIHYLIGVLIEAILICIGSVFHGRTIFLCWKHKILHSNFLAIMTNMYLSFQTGSLFRIVLILYESRLISWADVGDTPIPFLNTLRFYGLIHAFYLLPIITIERVLATVFVADYELKHRHYIPAILNILVNCFILATSYAFVARLVNAYICCTIGLVPNFGCALILHRLLRWNQEKLTRLTDSLRRFPNDKYSLSLRVQLKENIWSLQKIEFGVVIMIVALIVNLMLLFGPVFILTRPDQLVTLQWCMWAANIVMAVSVAGSAPMGYFAVALHTGARPFYVRWYLRKFAKDVMVSPAEVKQTDAYFNQLHSQWDYAMRR
ncbi:hypothetical protein PMAYCL1PPCAC_16242, partial [Pristionchus mayeri]